MGPASENDYSGECPRCGMKVAVPDTGPEVRYVELGCGACGMTWVRLVGRQAVSSLPQIAGRDASALPDDAAYDAPVFSREASTFADRSGETALAALPPMPAAVPEAAGSAWPGDPADEDRDAWTEVGADWSVAPPPPAPAAATGDVEQRRHMLHVLSAFRSMFGRRAAKVGAATLRVTCPVCGTTYRVRREDALPGGREVRCSRCEHQWRQMVW